MGIFELWPDVKPFTVLYYVLTPFYKLDWVMARMKTKKLETNVQRRRSWWGTGEIDTAKKINEKSF